MKKRMKKEKLEVGDCILVNGRDHCMVVEVSNHIYVDIVETKKRTVLMEHDHYQIIEWWQFNAVETSC